MGRLELRKKLVLAVLAESKERLLLHDRQAILYSRTVKSREQRFII
jgi:hypothetical protein